MRKVLLTLLPLLFAATELSAALIDLKTVSVVSPSTGCLSNAEPVVIKLFNNGTNDLSSSTFNLSYRLDGGPAVTDVGVNIPGFIAGGTRIYTFSTLANLALPGAHTLKVYSWNLTGDNTKNNDTINTIINNTNSVGGMVSSPTTVCAGVNSGTLTLSANTGSVLYWQSSLNGTTWLSIGNAGSLTQTYTNLNDTTLYRAIVQNGGCDLDSSASVTITVTPIPFLSSSLNTGICDGATFSYLATSTFPGATYSWTKVYPFGGPPWFRVNPDTGSVAGNWNPIINVFHTNTDSSEHYAYYRIITTSNNCSNSGETVTIRIDSLPPIASGTITGISPVCQSTTVGAYWVNPIIHAYWYQWSYLGGSGASFTSSLSATNIIFSSSATSGNLFVNAVNYCGQGASSPVFPITVEIAATANAGLPDTVCQGATALTLAGASIGGGATTGAWSILSACAGCSLSTTAYTNTPDTVTFTPNANFNGSVILRLTTDNPTGVCNSVFSDRSIWIDTAAISIAGGPDTVCQSATPNPITLVGSSVGGPVATVGTWSIISGSGTLSLLTATDAPDTVMYTPAANFAGTDTLALTTNDPGTACGLVISKRIITIDSMAIVNAGRDTAICQGEVYRLSGSRLGGATATTWTSSGTGTFDSIFSLTAIYTPSPADFSGRTVALILTSIDPAGPCLAVLDSMILTIDTAAIAIAGVPDTVCQSTIPVPIVLSGSIVGGPVATVGTWSIVSGTGSLSLLTATNQPDTVTYTPAANFAGTDTLILTTNDPGTACGVVTSVRIITIDSMAMVSAGSDSSICAGSTYVLLGTRLGGATSTKWTTSGDGSFTNDTILSPVYTPGASDIIGGTVTLTITSNNPAGPCSAVVDSMILSIDPPATANAGTDTTICGSDTYLLAGIIGGSAVSVTWTTTGNGTFNNDTLLNAIYTPGTLDITNGTVFLIISTNNPPGICFAAVDSMLLTISTPAIVSAGTDSSICGGSTFPLSGSIGGGASSAVWTTSGDGVFNDDTLLTPVYTPGITDILNGTVDLIISSNNPAGPCSVVIDSMILTINPPAIISAGADTSICAGSNYTLAGAIGGSAVSSTWSSSGNGSFDDSTLVNAVYTPGTNDISNGIVTLTITSNDPAGICFAAVDSMLLTINIAATVTAGGPDSVCDSGSPSAITLTGAGIGGSATSATWSIISGSGTLSLLTATNAPDTVTYTPAPNSVGTDTLLLTTDNPGTACGAVISKRIVKINPAAVAIGGGPDLVCESVAPVAITLSGASVGGGAITGAWSIISGSGILSNITQQNNAGIALTTYTPAAGFAGTDTLMLTTNDPGTACGAGTTVRIITVNPKPIVIITDPLPVCFPATVDLTADSIKVGSIPDTLTFSYFVDAGATIPLANPAAVATSGIYYIVGVVPATGCSDTAAVNVSIAVGGTVLSDALVCKGSNGDTLTLVGYSGAIQNWEYSQDGGSTWNFIINTTNKYYYSNLTLTTWFRAVMTGLCPSSTSVEARITVDPSPLPIGGTVSANDTVCSGANHDTLTLTGHSGNIIRWEYSIDGGNTWVYINNTDTSLIYNNLLATTIYHAVVQNSPCASAISSNDTITVTPPSIAGSITGATAGCAFANGGTLLLGGYSGAIVTWQYSTDAGTTWIDTANTTNMQVYDNIPDTIFYRAIVKSGVCNNDTSAAAAIIVYPKPTALFTADTVCLGGTTTFANGSTIASGFIQFNQWDFGDNIASLSLNPTHTYSQSGLVTVNLVVTSDFSCLDTATIGVFVDPLPNEQIIASGPLSFCCGGSVSLSAVGGLNYLWSTTATTQGIIVNNCLASGLYTLTVTNPATLCTNTSSVTIVIFPLPVANAGNDTTISLGSSYTLNGQGGTIYLWNPGTGLSNPAIADPVASPLITTTYELTATDINGCMDIDSLTITVITDYNVIVTNLMTTNGDGFNDKWIVKNIENYPGTEAIVVNREGQQVYYSSSYDNSWEGLNKDGKPLPDGTYYYFLKFKNNNKLYKGPLTILNEK